MSSQAASASPGGSSSSSGSEAATGSGSATYSGPKGSSQITIDPYNSKTGAGTLSYYADKYNTSVDNLMTLNPTIKNENEIQEGASLYVPSPVYQTTNNVQQAVNDSATSVGNRITALQQGSINSVPGANQTPVGSEQGKQTPNGNGSNSNSNPTGTDNSGADNNPSDPRFQSVVSALNSGITDANQISNQLNASGANGGNYTPEEVSGILENYSPGSTGALSNYNAEAERINSAVQTLQSSVASGSASDQILANQITTQYQQEIAQQQKWNANIENAFGGIAAKNGLEGSTFYTTELSAEEQNGIAKLSKLQNDEAMAVSKFQNAQSQNNFKDQISIQNELTKLDTDRTKTLQTIQKTATARATTSQKNATAAASIAKNYGYAISAAMNALPKDQQAAYLTNISKSFGVDTPSLALAISNIAMKPTASKKAASGITYKSANFASALQGGLTLDGVNYNGRGKDGYVDPNLYGALYTKIENTYGNTSAKTFLKDFPPSTELNPSADLSNAPAAIQKEYKTPGSASGSSKTSSGRKS